MEPLMRLLPRSIRETEPRISTASSWLKGPEKFEPCRFKALRSSMEARLLGRVPDILRD